jgi:hypothetical protein
MCQISSRTLTELTIDDAFKVENEIRTSALVKYCRSLNMPRLVTLRWRIQSINGQHPYLTDLNERDFPISRTQFPVLQQLEIQFQHPAVQQLWNCSALKAAFKEYDDLIFIFPVPTADGPMRPHETVSAAELM